MDATDFKDLLEKPVHLVQFFLHRGDIQLALKNVDRKRENQGAWYFSPEAIKLYEGLSTLDEKIIFFNEYLDTIWKKKEQNFSLEDLVANWGYRPKIAFILAKSMVDSNLEFAGYPNVIDPEKNPIVKYVKTTTIRKGEEALCRKLLSVLHTGTDKNADQYSAHSPDFGGLSKCAPNEPLSDMYKIERDIIIMFGSEHGEAIYSPYKYSITKDLDEASKDSSVDTSKE